MIHVMLRAVAASRKCWGGTSVCRTEALIESFGFFLLLTLATPTLTLHPSGGGGLPAMAWSYITRLFLSIFPDPPPPGAGNQAASYDLELYHSLIPLYIPSPL